MKGSQRVKGRYCEETRNAQGEKRSIIPTQQPLVVLRELLLFLLFVEFKIIIHRLEESLFDFLHAGAFKGDHINYLKYSSNTPSSGFPAAASITALKSPKLADPPS